MSQGSDSRTGSLSDPPSEIQRQDWDAERGPPGTGFFLGGQVDVKGVPTSPWPNLQSTPQSREDESQAEICVSLWLQAQGRAIAPCLKYLQQMLKSVQEQNSMNLSKKKLPITTGQQCQSLCCKIDAHRGEMNTNFPISGLKSFNMARSVTSVFFFLLFTSILKHFSTLTLFLST